MHTHMAQSSETKRNALDSLPPLLLTDRQSAAVFGISVRKFDELRSEPWMPKPIELGPRLLRWPYDELMAAIKRMPRQSSPNHEPLQLKKSRAAKATQTEVRP